MSSSLPREVLASVIFFFFMLQTHAQNVGINTTTPDHPFQVNVDSSYAVTLSDQSAESPNSFLTIALGQSAAQRVICGLTGYLSQVDLTLNHLGTPGIVTIMVRQGGTPDGAVLIEQSIAVDSSTASTHQVVFAGQLPSINLGDSIFLEVTYVSGGTVVWSKNSLNPYGPGIAYLYTGSWTILAGDDMIFETHMNQLNALSIPVLKVTDGGRVSLKDYTLPESDGGNGYVMVTDGNGEVSWTDRDSLGFWKMGGNTGTDSTHYVGTTDNQPLRFKLNDEHAGIWDGDNGNYALGVGALESVTTGKGNISIGTRALSRITFQGGLVALGDSALFHNGLDVVQSYHAIGNTAVGFKSMYSNTTGYFNTACGFQALYSNNTGGQNTANGYKALYSNTTGRYNTAYGENSLYYNTTGDANTAVGSMALWFNSTGSANTAYGRNSLFYNDTGFGNTANGASSLHSNTTGNYNTASGSSSLYWNTTGLNNTASGSSSLYWNTTGLNNTANGASSLFSNTTGGGNTANGASSLFSNTTGGGNTASGYYSLNLNTTGDYNTASGYSSLSSNTTGLNNVANGAYSLSSNTTGRYNTANGYSALYSNTSSNYNTATGRRTLYYNTTGDGNTGHGARALSENTTGNYNTASGRRSLNSNTTGNYNTGIGFDSDVDSGNRTNATALGYQAIANSSNKVRIGNSSVSSNGGQVGWSSYSDARIKDDVKENVPGLDFISALRPVTYHYNVSRQNQLIGIVDTLEWEGKYDIESIQFSGFLAQDVEAAAGQIGYDFSGVDKSGDILGLRYAEFTVPLVKAVQELTERNDQLSVLLGAQHAMIEAQQVEINALKSIQTENSELNELLEKITAVLESKGIMVAR